MAGKADDIKAEPKPQVKQEEPPGKESKSEIQKVKEWLVKANAKEDPDKLDDKDNPPTDTKDQEIVLDSAKLSITRSALASSLPTKSFLYFMGSPVSG